jgi:hypothetical protein
MEDKPKKNPKIEITELFGAKDGNDWYRFFYGIIKRETDNDGTPYVFSKILVEDEIHKGYIYSRANEQQILSKKMDELVLMVLDKGLHEDIGKSSKIVETDFFHN